MFGVVVHSQTLKETDDLRGDIPRSRWIERALVMYNACMKEKEEQNDGVRGPHASKQAAPAAPTSTPMLEAQTTLLEVNPIGGLDLEEEL